MQTSLLDLKEHASSLASSGLKKDSRLKSLEIALEQKKEECLKVENQLKRVRSSNKEIRHRHDATKCLLLYIIMTQSTTFEYSHIFSRNADTDVNTTTAV